MSELEKITQEVTEEILHKFTVIIQMGTLVGENTKIRDFRLNKLDYFVPNEFRLYSIGFDFKHRLFISRVSLTLASPMNLKLYPLDRQKCSLRVASFE